MQNRPRLNRSQIETLLFMRSCSQEEGSIFPYVPNELILEISGYGREENQKDFALALHYVAYGKLALLKELLTAKPFMVLYGAGITTMPGGSTVERTLLGCAITSGDPEVLPYVKSVYSNLKNGEAEREKELALYRPYIEAMETQEPDDLTWLFKIIIESDIEDVRKELATGDDYDWGHKSELRNALNKFRKDKLEKLHINTGTTLTEPRMLCNYKNRPYACDLLEAEWDNLIVGGNNYDKHDLVARQIIGLIDLVELPAYERYVFAGGQIEGAIKGEAIVRSFEYKHEKGKFFPVFDLALFNSHSGVGFDSFVSIYGCRVLSGRWLTPVDYKTYVEQKLQSCKTYAARAEETASVMCDVLKRS